MINKHKHGTMFNFKTIKYKKYLTILKEKDYFFISKRMQ